MSYKIYFLYLLFLAVITSCNNKAVEYNNYLAKIQKSVLPEVQAFAKKMEQVSDGDVDLKNLKNDAQNIIGFLDKKIAEASSLKVADGGQDLKNAIINQLKFQRGIYYKIQRLESEKISEEERNTIIAEFANSEAEAQKFDEKILQSQKQYAKKNNFSLENK